MGPRQLRNRLLLSLALGLAVFIGLLFWGDFRSVGGSLRDFRWVYLPAILALTLFNYALRFAKWHYYLRLTGVRQVRLRDSFLLFFAGLGLTVTPAKLGEWIKSYFIRELHGVPISRTAPIVVAERVTDGLGMLILAFLGLLLLDQGWVFVAIAAAMGLLLVAAFQYRPFARWSISVASRVPVLSRYTGFIEGFYASAHALFSPKPLVLGVTLGAISWLGEGIAMYYVLLGLGAVNSGELVVQGIFILAVTTLAGAVFLLPGGLGVAEGGIAGLSHRLVGLAEGPAATATLLIRICTLWFGVGLGIIALAAVVRRLGNRPEAAPPHRDKPA